VLRASSRLAPSRSTRPCDLPVRKTRDASNRLLPPERMTCTLSPYVPGSRGPLSRSGTPHRSPRLLRCIPEETGVFTTPEPLRPHRSLGSVERDPRAFVLAASGHEPGPIGPEALDGMRSLAPLSRLPLGSSRSRAFARAHVIPRTPPYGFGETRVGRKSEEAAESTVATVS
jgi:hypothetical protein